MARNPKSGQPQGGADAADPAVAAQQKRKKLLLTVGAAVLLVGISVVLTLALTGGFSSESEAEATPVSYAPSGKQTAVYYPLNPPFVVNFEDRGRSRFLQAELTLMLRDAEITKALDLHMPAIRNALVMLLSAQSFENLQTPEGKEALREEALVRVQQVLRYEIGRPGVEQVLFVNFVMQ